MAATAESLELEIIESDERIESVWSASIGIVDKAQSIEIIDQESDVLAAEFIAQVKASRKANDEARHWLTDPLEAHKKSIINVFKEKDQPLERALQIVGQKHLSWTIAQREAARKETERLRKLAEAKQARQAAKAEEKGVEPPPVVIPMPTVQAPPKTVRTESGSVTIRTTWKHEVLDMAALPDEYKIADEVKLGKVVRAGVREIAGVRIYEEMVV